MKEFFEKVSKKIICGALALVAVLTFVVAILNICDAQKYGVGEMINSMIVIIVVAALGYFVWNDKKDKGIMLVLVLIGSAFLAKFGSSIDSFINAGESGKSAYTHTDDLNTYRASVAAIVFGGLTSLALFGGVACHVIIKFTDKLPVDRTKFVGTVCYMASVLFTLVYVILTICCSKYYRNNGLAISIISSISGMLEAFVLASLLNQEM